MWMRPPDPENQVVVGFSIDENTKSKVAIVLGCFFQQQRNFMVPGIPAGKSVDGMTPEQMRQELEYLRAENAYLKKLEALIQEKRSAPRKKH